MKKSIIAALIAASCAPAMADSFYIVVPVQNRTATAGNVAVALNGAPLPAGAVGVAYPGFELTNLLQVTGDPDFNAAGVTWSVASGAFPPGLALNSATGVISGTPLAQGPGTAQVRALYKGKSASRSFTVPISASIKQDGSTRTWSDGAVATSCKGYRTGNAGYIYQGATGDGAYRIDVDGGGPLGPVDVLCDMTTDGGGWTVIQNRHNGSVDFYRTYAEFAAGFGTAATEYWVGLDRIAALTSAGAAIRVDMARTTGQTAFALYSTFKVGPASDKYRLAVSGYSGTAGDSFSTRGMQFSAKDSDNDTYGGSCAVDFRGAWWYSDCHSSNLNGAYLNGPHESFADGVIWHTFTTHYESLKSVSMKIREN